MIEAINKELQLRSDYLKKNIVTTIYFGGGTPSILNKLDLQSIFETLYKTYSISKNVEVNFECNPEDITFEKLKILSLLGVNRLSIGVQSFNDKDLIFMNRAHNAKQAIESIRLSQSLGFNNISIDLMFSLPEQTLKEWQKNLKLAFELNIQHISCYSLTIKEKTKLFKLIKSKKISELNEIESSVHFEELVKEAERHNFIQYEISNFGKKGFFSKHNLSYWMDGTYLGVGPSAHSYNYISRQWNVSNNQKYINSLSNNVIPSEIEYLTENQKYNEYILKSLRTKWGINMPFIKKSFGLRYVNHINKESKKWIDSRCIINKSGKLILSERGKFISDSICESLFYIK